MLRVGHLYRAGYLLKLVHDSSPLKEELITDIPKFHDLPTIELLEIIQFGGWIEYDGTGRILTTVAGANIVEIENPVLKLRAQVMTLIEKIDPPWIAAITQGRGAAANYIPPEALQCLQEAGLLDAIEEDVVSWWDSIDARNREEKEKHLVDIGRIGERLSYTYEKERTGVEPRWIALEYAGAGYDLISRISKTDANRLIIEVKTSTQAWDNAAFFLTRREWEVLTASDEAVAHLWSLAYEMPRHEVVPIEQLARHIPVDQGSGQWQKVMVPFSIA